MAGFVVSVNHIAQMKEKSGIETSGGGVEVGGHLLGDQLGFVGGADTGIAESVEANFAEVFNFLDAGRADDFGKIHFASARDGGKRTELEFAPVGHADMTVDGLARSGGGRNEERVGKSGFRERGGHVGSRRFILRHNYSPFCLDDDEDGLRPW